MSLLAEIRVLSPFLSYNQQPDEMPMIKPITLFILVLATTVSCTRNVDGSWKIPFVYRIDIQQGNVIDQRMLDRLRPGMDKNQVRFILGTPLISDPFHADRWDYIYSMEPGGDERTQRHVTLYFKNDKLSYINGDVQVSHKPRTEDQPLKDRTVAVPLEEEKKGFFSSLFTDSEEKEKVQIDKNKAEVYKGMREEADSEL